MVQYLVRIPSVDGPWVLRGWSVYATEGLRCDDGEAAVEMENRQSETAHLPFKNI